MSSQQVILINCPDEKGLVYKVSEVLFKSNLNIVTNAEIVDHSTKSFFMRTAFTGDCDSKSLVDSLKKALPSAAEVNFCKADKKKLLLFATKETHCLGDILLRCQTGELKAEILGVLSQYDDLKNLVEQFQVPFHFVPVENDNRESHEKKLHDLCNKYQADYIVLAKYMRILSSDFIKPFQHRIINIHHSFLPAFIGANPYKQAFERGVKIIGATAHYVTEDLDEGPIIAQAVTPVNQGHDHFQMAREGKEIERAVLARALNLVLNDQVILHGHRTIVFE